MKIGSEDSRRGNFTVLGRLPVYYILEGLEAWQKYLGTKNHPKPSFRISRTFQVSFS